MDYGRVKLGMYDDPRKLHTGNEDELLIFGYSCKLFRDDEKAISLENGEHLIPWMGDSSLMIDRFDVRGALYDLSEAEAKGKPLEEVLTEGELKEEEICDQERYFALYHDEIQYQLACEEEAKRLQMELASDAALYNQVGFSYIPTEVEENEIKDEPQLQPVMAEPIMYNPSSDEDIFIPPPEMNIPPGTEVPKTVKQNKIIIKTAKFVVSQGAQMEIIIKTKQAGNAMFNFLAFDNPLNAYYKHVVNLIRNGRYKWEEDLESTARERSEQYLHPNLSQSHPRPPPDLTPGVTSSPARPSPHCAYSKLITKIREKQKASSTPMEDTELPSSSSPLLPSSPLHATASSISGLSHELRPSIPAAVGGVNLGSITGLVDYPSSFNPTADGNSDGEDSEPRKATRGPTRDYRHIKWPPPDLQMVIDKMACYIIKNGAAFEEVVKSRGDSRFEFLNKSHEYHPYYKCKMQLYNEVYGDVFKNASKGHHDWRKKSHAGGGGCDGTGLSVNGGSSSSKKSSSSTSENAKNSGGSRTISFSIKSREQEVSLTSRTTFPIESSTSEEDDDLEEDERERRRVERAQRRQARRNREEREKREREELLKKERLKREKEEAEERKESRKAAEEDSSGNEDLYDIFKYAQEMEQESTTTSQVQQQAQQQQAQSESPDEASSKQEERKKKAAAFLSKLKDCKEDKNPPIYGPQIPPDIAAGLLKSGTQSPCSSRESAEKERVPPPLPPPPTEPPHQPPPPLPKSPSPPPVIETMDIFSFDKGKAPSYGRELSASPKRSSKVPLENSSSIASVLCGLNESYGGKQSSERVAEPETQSRKSRSHKKHSRQKSESRSPSSRRERKKRKRSRGGPSHRRKKRRSRSRSRSRSRAYAKSHRSSHKKKQSKHHSSHRDKEKARKKKHKKHRSPSLVSSLPSSESSSPSTPSTLPSETETDMDVQVIESDEGKRSSRGSSIVSLPPTLTVPGRYLESKKISSDAVSAEVEENIKRVATGDGSASGEENSSSGTATALPQPLTHSTHKYSRSFLSAIENSNSSDGPPQPVEKKTLFNPNASSAMAKIAQGLRAKLNAMLEKESKLE